MKLLLISNSTNAGEEYLYHPKEQIRDFLGKDKTICLFIPYAAVTFSFDDYEKKVQERFLELGHEIRSIHRFLDPVQAVEEAEAIVIGGGNTWQLTKMMQDKKLIDVIINKVNKGTPYIGWSAGSNVACPSIRTTNDMPIVQPDNFSVLNLVPFQINPHYLDANPDGHAGETREMRIEEFLEINRNIYVVGLREGTMLLLDGNRLKLIGPRKARIFKFDTTPVEVDPNSDLGFLLDE
jgi:dipeptidase E